MGNENFDSEKKDVILLDLLRYRVWLIQTGVRLRRETRERHECFVRLDREEGAKAYLDKGHDFVRGCAKETEVRTDTSDTSVQSRSNLDIRMQERESRGLCGRTRTGNDQTSRNIL